jgi:hypothetical protein
MSQVGCDNSIQDRGIEYDIINQTTERILMKLENNETFKITYFAKKHGKHITRSGKWTDLCREWISKAGEKLLTYYDTDNNGYRTAKGDYMISLQGGNDEQL